MEISHYIHIGAGTQVNVFSSIQSRQLFGYCCVVKYFLASFHTFLHKITHFMYVSALCLRKIIERKKRLGIFTATDTVQNKKKVYVSYYLLYVLTF